MVVVDVEYIKTSRESRTSHLDLNENCLERGGVSTNHKGVLAQYLGTSIPSGRILLCHGCNNPNCSNPKHLYWGTDKENIDDAKKFGTWKSGWDKIVEKYGYEGACDLSRKRALGNKGGGNKGKPKSEEHKRKISEALKNMRE